MKGNICRETGCSVCCQETEMELTGEDIRRIMDLGKSDFFLTSKSTPHIRNIDGKCVFLDEDGDCSIYSERPEGCRLYPLVMNLSNWHAELDVECPHRKRFDIDPDDVVELDVLVRKLMEESS